MRNIAMVVAAAFLCTGCAGISVQSLGTSDDADRKARGFRYWHQAPFLFVRSDGQGALSAEIKWLPDTTQKMSARPFAVLASNESKLDFSNGMLTKATIKANETEVISASLTALGKALVAAAADGSASAAPGRVPVPYIYKIVIEGGKLSLLGGPAMDQANTAPATVLAVPGAGEQK
ncbi:hypothetical protein [Pseudorhodoferax sp. Leaf274]|uniref:hypothetical protein n=1 Tax=Pseudorhodoferax sp. Leaf274 TaxID=1736318 RepID=UPI0012E1C43A|nr:hypothetical protein [Pseudorhodoferax sp. Leaf274]